MIARLGAESHKDREAATKALIGLGPEVLPLLRKHRSSSDLEVRHRCQRVVEPLGSSVGANPLTGP